MNKIITLLFLFFSLTNAFAQGKFQGTILGGFTTSQIDGDELLGFHKFGLTAGAKVTYPFKPKFEGSVEVIYSQRGSKGKLLGSNGVTSNIQLNYFELPVYISVRDWYVEKGDYYKMRGHFGFSYASLISSSVQDLPYESSLFNNSNFSWLIGATYSFTPKLAMTARYTRGISKLLVDENIQIGHLLTYFWAIRAEYNF